MAFRYRNGPELPGESARDQCLHYFVQRRSFRWACSHGGACRRHRSRSMECHHPDHRRIGPPHQSTKCLTSEQTQDLATTFSPVATTVNSECAPMERSLVGHAADLASRLQGPTRYGTDRRIQFRHAAPLRRKSTDARDDDRHAADGSAEYTGRAVGLGMQIMAARLPFITARAGSKRNGSVIA